MKEKKPHQNTAGRNIKTRSYLDWAATAKPDWNLQSSGSAEEDMTIYGNPSSSHAEGRLAREALESARSRCAAVLGVSPEKLYFTSGGTEANALVLHSQSLKKGSGRLLYSAIEHPSVRENCLKLKRLGFNTDEAGVDENSRITETILSRALEKHPDTRLVTVMAVNNETGSLMDIKALVSITRLKKGAPIHFHSDLVQALGKTPIDISAWDIDSASFSAHKLGGPCGVGLLYLKKPLEALYAGGEQEGKVRPGTENVQGALALADLLERRANAETVKAEKEKALKRFKYLIGELRKIKRCVLIPEDRGDEDERFSPWILQVRVKGLPGMVMTRALDEAGIAVSTGSACSSSSRDRPVLAAMGVDKSARLEGFRISQGWSTSEADFDALLSGIEKAISFL
jgi:cysteine desulfurase